MIDNEPMLIDNQVDAEEEFSIFEQMDCVRREIDFRQRVLTEFSGDADQAEVAKLQRETAIMEAVFETLQFVAGIGRFAEENPAMFAKA